MLAFFVHAAISSISVDLQVYHEYHSYGFLDKNLIVFVRELAFLVLPFVLMKSIFEKGGRRVNQLQETKKSLFLKTIALEKYN